ncbi:Vacuolar protein sorting-associated protein 33A [Echinococcus granulosus]|uniref:Vacuolar protein sorting-associated protein 33A n=1 Tax=Echinococcus granulosus TaxID=6210 RepID=W6ULU0_ECHGR|nr:Vacuolar protein sorting-associated protein 33A [Echinococcus granulosus]EUB62096.1 Vacuolar protein sorting-associated protein 33A [Echinococcus granulosus]
MPTVTRSLSTAPLKDVYQKELLQMLDAHRGPKAIYWEREAIPPVNLIVGHSLLKDFSLRNKENSLFNFAKGLMKFQSVYGLFPRIRSKGPKAKRIAEMLSQMRQEAMATANLDAPARQEGTVVQPLESPGQTDLLIIIDRSVDALTPCLSQLTYEGLINELWPVMHGKSAVIVMYGPEHMITLNNLRKLGLLEESSRLTLIARPTGGPADILSGDTSTAVRRTIASVSLAYASTLRRSLRLHVTDETPPPREEQNLDAAFARIFGGWVPISVRLVQAMTLGWPTRPLISTTSGTGGALLSNAASTALYAGRRLVSHVQAASASSGSYVTDLIPAVEVDEVQNPGETGISSTGAGLIKRPTPSAGPEGSKTVVIAFVGGVTHSELAALRKVAAYDEGKQLRSPTPPDLNKRQNLGDHANVSKHTTLTADA